MNPLLPIEELALLFLALAALGGWTAWKSSTRCAGAARHLVPALRLVALAALAMIAFNPGRWVTEREEETREWAVLVDSSASMSTRDLGADTRWSKALQIAGQLESRATAVEAVKLYRFDSDPHPVPALQELRHHASDGQATDIIGSAAKVLERYQSGGRRLAGIIVLTDGRQVPPRSSEDFAVKARALRAPVHPVVLGEAVQTRDLSLQVRRRQFVAFAGQPLTIGAQLRARNLANIRPAVELLDANGRHLAEKLVPLAGEGLADVRFELKAEQEGYAAYRLRVKPWPGESTLANNEAGFGVVSLKEKVRILLAEGTPYWDSKFIAQLLQKQGNVDLTMIYRVTQEKYFSLETARPPATNAVSQAFPETLEAMARHDLIVVGKGFEYFLNAGRAEALKQFVRERGGALLFARGKSYSGELPEVEPLEPIAWDREWTGEFRWQPTDAGEEAGLFSDQLPGRRDPVWDKLPALSRAWQGDRPKAFAQVLAEGVSHLGEHTRRIPVVASQRFGKGLVVAVNSDDLWQWDFFPKFEGASRLYQDFWLHLINWAVTCSDFLPGHEWSLRLSSQVANLGQPVRARVQKRGRETEGGQPVLRLQGSGTSRQEVALAPVPDQTGFWEGIFSLDQPGNVRLELTDRSSTSRAVYETLHVTAPPTEQEDLSPDRQAMEELAAQTDGRVLTETDAVGLIGKPAGPDPLSSAENARWVSSWDRGPWLVLLLGAFGWEWFLRRRNGLT